MKTITTIFTTLLLTATFLSTPARATSNDYVVLESITAVNTTVLLGENLEYELVVSSPSSFTWDPKAGNIDGNMSVLLCSTDIFTQTEISVNCSYSNQQGKYQLRIISGVEVEEINGFKFYKFIVSGIPTINKIGEFFPYSVKITNASTSNAFNETHYYNLGYENPTDGFSYIASIQSPDLFSQKINVVSEIINAPENEIESDQPPLEEEILDDTVEEEIVIPNTPPPPATIQRPVARAVQVTPVVAPAIQSNFFLPAIKGDQYWKPLREVKGNFENWRVGKRNSLDGVANRFTKTNGSMMTFTTTGDAVSVRYLAGKKRGGFSIYVNGQFLDRVEANQKRKKTLVKTWDGLGDGKHYIDIVAELSNDQSLAINGVQKLKK